LLKEEGTPAVLFGEPVAAWNSNALKSTAFWSRHAVAKYA
jgi:hypothetical protein